MKSLMMLAIFSLFIHSVAQGQSTLSLAYIGEDEFLHWLYTNDGFGGAHSINRISFGRKSCPEGNGQFYGYMQLGPLNFSHSTTAICFQRSDRVSGPPQNSQVLFQTSSLTADGKNLIAYVTYRQALLSKMLVNGQSEIVARYTVAFTSCDGKPLREEKKAARQDIGSIIEEFQSIQYRKFFHCSFELYDGVLNDTMFENIGSVLGGSMYPGRDRIYNIDIPGGATAARGTIFQSTGNLSLEFQVGQIRCDYHSPNGCTRIERGPNSRYTRQVLLRPNQPLGDEGESSRAAKSAAREFISLIKGYGDVIIDVYDAKLTPAQQQAQVMAAVRLDKQRILDLLKTINENFTKLDLVSQLEIVQSVNEAYDFVKEIEVQVGKLQNRSQRLNLGTLIQVVEK